MLINQPAHTVSVLPLTKIRKNFELNPRKHRNPDDFKALKESMERHGFLFQPIVVRPVQDDHYELIAGNSRYDAASELNWSDIQVMIRELSDSEANAVAGEENIIRSQMTPIEEADHAAKRMAALNNDKQEVAKELGWSISKLDTRLLLTYCSQAVRKALAERTIKIGHAMILATMPHELQESAVAAVISENLSIPDTQLRADRIGQKLSAACFNTTDCQGCKNNTSTFVDMFEDVITEGSCTNGVCWQQKTIARLSEIEKELSDEFQVVKFSKDVPAGSTITLQAEGKNGVGKEQLGTCASCANYGCVISSVVGHEGKVQKPVCFSLECHTEKVKTHSERVASSQAVTPAKSNEPRWPVPKKKIAQEQAGIKAPAKSVLRHVFQGIARAAEHEVKNDVVYQKAIAVLNMIRFNKLPELPALFSEAFKLSDECERFKHLLNLTAGQLDELIALLASSYVTSVECEDAFEKDRYRKLCLAIIDKKKPDQALYWKVDVPFLNGCNKAAMLEILDQSGFIEEYENRKGKNSFGKLTKVTEIIAAVESFPFDFTGFIPAVADFKKYVK